MGLVVSPIGTNIAWVSQPQRSDRFSALLANSRLSRFTSCPLSGPFEDNVASYIPQLAHANPDWFGSPSWIARPARPT